MREQNEVVFVGGLAAAVAGGGVFPVDIEAVEGVRLHEGSDLVDEFGAVLFAADHIREGRGGRARLVEVPPTDGNPGLKAGTGSLEISELRDQWTIALGGLSDGESVRVEHQESVVNVREACDVQIFRGHGLTLAGLCPGLVVAHSPKR